MEAGLATTTRVGLLGGKSPLLRLQSDERLIALLRAGNAAAFDVLFGRYRSRLLAFCRHMLASREDAEDILQDVFTAAYNAILADRREINVRPWLYRIARNRCLNHLRRPSADGRDTMDDQLGAGGVTTAEVVHKRADLRHLLCDVQKLPETQRTALLLREIDALSYDQIALAMETTVPSVKSLLVRARMSLAEAAAARELTCDEVRERLAEVAEGLARTTPALKRHVRECGECRGYRKQLRKTSVAMAVAFPVAPLLALKKILIAKAGATALAGGAGGAGGGAAATATGAAATSGVAAGAAGGAGAALPVGLSAAASKAIAGMAVTAILAGGAVEAKKVTSDSPAHSTSHAATAVVATPAPPPDTGGAVLAGPSEAPLEKGPVATPEKPKDKAAEAKGRAAAGGAGATGATGTIGATGGAGAGAMPPAVGAQGAEPPASGSTSYGGPVDTGGATAPPEPPPASPRTAPSGAATGASGPQFGTTGPQSGATGPQSPLAH